MKHQTDFTQRCYRHIHGPGLTSTKDRGTAEGAARPLHKDTTPPFPINPLNMEQSQRIHLTVKLSKRIPLIESAIQFSGIKVAERSYMLDRKAFQFRDSLENGESFPR